MSLKYTVETLDGLEEATAALYKQTEAGYQLDVEGAAPKEKVNEFRNNNIDLTTKLNDIETTLKGLDVGQFKTMFESVQAMAQSKEDTEMANAIEAGPDAINTLIEGRAANRASAMQTDMTEKLTKSKDTASKYRSQLEDAKITSELTRFAAEKGVRSTAVADVLLRGKQVFKLDDDANVVAMKGDDIVYNKNNEQLTISEYVENLSEEAPHLFEASKGGGSSNSNKTSSSSKNTVNYNGNEVDLSGVEIKQ